MDIVNKLVEDDRTFEDMKKDYSNKNKNFRRSFT